MEMRSRIFELPATSFFLFGPRGTGKSTLLGDRLSDAVWIDLLQPEVERSYLARPERLREVTAAHPDGTDFVIDEIQRVPELLTVVHSVIETKRHLRFALTGSSARKLKRTAIDLLAGRAVYTTLHPYLASELGAAFDLAGALERGLVPLVFEAPDPDATLRSYISLYLKEEVQAEGLVRNMGGFARFLEAASFSHASVLNASAVARECGVERRTVLTYFDILEDLLLAWRLPVFTRRARRQTAAHPKFYLFDAGVFRSLRPTGPLDGASEIDGAALEGLVAQHLRAWVEYRGGDHQLFFWRTRSGVEVDFVIYGAEEFAAIEVKNTAEVRPRDLRALRAFGEDYPEANLLFLHRGRESLVRDGIRCLPVDVFLRSLHPDRMVTRGLPS